MSSFPALMYHSLMDGAGVGFSLSTTAFETQVHWLKQEGYTVEGLAGLSDRLATGQFPDRYVVMTFDDGNHSDLYAADLLGAAGFQATYFVAKHYCQRADGLSLREIRQLAATGAIGSHSVTHPPMMTKLSPAQMRIELADSKAWLEDVTGVPIPTFSFPNGDINALALKLAFEAGYTLVANSYEWWNSVPGIKSTRVLNRVGIRTSFSMDTFRQVVQQNVLFFSKRRVRAGLVGVAKAVLSDKRVRQLKQFKRVPGYPTADE